MSNGKSQLKCLSACPSCVVSYTGFLVAPLSTFLIMPVVDASEFCPAQSLAVAVAAAASELQHPARGAELLCQLLSKVLF